MVVEVFNPAYNNQTLKVSNVVDQAFRYCGISPNDISGGDMLEAAFYAMNQILEGWVNYKILQMNEVILPVMLENGIAYYPLPTQVYNVYDCQLTVCGRLLLGVYGSSTYKDGHAPANCFDNNINTYCELLAPDGYIQILAKPVNNTQPKYAINFVGILSQKDEYYKLRILGSNDGDDWVELYDTQRQIFFKGSSTTLNTVWFNIRNPQPFSYYKIEEYGGATLAIREIYLEAQVTSRAIRSIGRGTYQDLPAKTIQSTPVTYTLQKTNTNINIQFWGVPSNIPTTPNTIDISQPQSTYNFAILRAAQFPFNINYLQDEININRRFRNAFIYLLAAEMAALYKPEFEEKLLNRGNTELQKAIMMDNDLGGLRLNLSNKG